MPKLTTVQFSLAYTITVGLSVFIFIAYYVLAYRPEAHISQDDDITTDNLDNRSLKGNAIDERLLFWQLLSRPKQPLHS